MTSTTIRYPVLPENDQEFARVHPPGFDPGESDHLRHCPGDAFAIGGKPHDPDDPGPYGSPGWFQDRRTGRHRRNELPDPSEETKPSPHSRRRFWFEPEAGTHDADPPAGFTALQEDAWERWLIDSEPLAAAHRHRTALDRECGPAIALVARLIRWIAAVLVGSGAIEKSETRHDPAPALHRKPPVAPLPLPRTGNGYIRSWELGFDQRPVARGGAL